MLCKAAAAKSPIVYTFDVTLFWSPTPSIKSTSIQSHIFWSFDNILSVTELIIYNVWRPRSPGDMKGDSTF